MARRRPTHRCSIDVAWSTTITASSVVGMLNVPPGELDVTYHHYCLLVGVTGASVQHSAMWPLGRRHSVTTRRPFLEAPALSKG
jgi:hypothetical protein